MAEHRYPERTVASAPGHTITVGLRVPRRMDEALAVLRPLLAGSEVTLDGEQAAIECAAGVRALLGVS